MVVIKIDRSPEQDGVPTKPELIKALGESGDLMRIPHQFYFPIKVLKGLIKIKKAVLKNKAAYIKSGGGNKLTSAVLIVDGKSDAGKSTLASQIGLFFDPNMTLENSYCWTFEKLFRLIENATVGDCIILDEAMIANSRSANSQSNLKLIIALSQVRSKGVFIIFCINSVHQLEKTIPLSRANCLFHVKRIGGISGTPKYCVYDEEKMRQLVIKNAGKYSYAGVFPNLEWATFSRYFPFSDVKYDRMKHKESMKNVTEKDKGTKTQRKVQLALMKLVEYCRGNGIIKTYPEFANITGLASTTLAEYKRRYTDKNEK